MIWCEAKKTKARRKISRRGLIEYSNAAGSLDGLARSWRKQRARTFDVEPRKIRHELARDESLSRVWDFVAPPQEEIGAHLAHMMSIRLSEINVAEGLAIVLFETTEQAVGVLLLDFAASVGRSAPFFDGRSRN